MNFCKANERTKFYFCKCCHKKSTHRLFITSIITLVYGILFLALMIYALNNMSIFSVGLDYYLLPGSTKMLIHFFTYLPAILYIIDGLLGIWVKNHPDKVIILLILFIITAVIIVAYCFIGFSIGFTIFNLIILILDIVFGFQVRKAYKAASVY